MKDLNEYEIAILGTLSFANNIKYTDLNSIKLSTDHFAYYLRKLIKNDLIVKNLDGTYSLTNKGKNFVSKIDGENMKVEEQCKTVVVAICEKIEDDQKYYLLQKRARQPMKNYYCLPGGKSKLGELAAEAVVRELKEETGLTGDPVLKEIRHTIKKSATDNQILSDDIVYVFKIDNLRGDLLRESVEGLNDWFTIDEIGDLKLVIKNTSDSIQSLNNKSLEFREELHSY